jgi:hypothetical protein
MAAPRQVEITLVEEGDKPRLEDKPVGVSERKYRSRTDVQAVLNCLVFC